MRLRMIIVIIACVAVITGCNEKTISIVQIKDLFEKQGIPLEEPTELNKESVFLMTLNGVAPEPFIINDEQLISIYIYSSGSGVKKGIRDFDDKTATADVAAHEKYQVGNVLIIYDNESFKDVRVEKVIKEIQSLVS